MSSRLQTGLQDQDILNIKVFLRTYNDAMECAQSIANRENQRNHYKAYMKVLITSLKEDKLMIDKEGKVIASQDIQAANIYQLLKFSQNTFIKFGLDHIDGKRDFERKLDTAIEGLESEILEKKQSILSLMDELNLKPRDKQINASV